MLALLLAVLLATACIGGCVSSVSATHSEEWEGASASAEAQAQAEADAVEEQALEASIQQEALVQLHLCDVAQKEAASCTSDSSAASCNDEFAVHHLGACFKACDCSRERCQDKEECRVACERTVAQELVDRIMKQRQESSGSSHLQCHLNDVMDDKISHLSTMLSQLLKENDKIQRHMPRIRCNNRHECLAAHKALKEADQRYKDSADLVEENRLKGKEFVVRIDKETGKPIVTHKGKHAKKEDAQKDNFQRKTPAPTVEGLKVTPSEAEKAFPELKLWKSRHQSDEGRQLNLLMEDTAFLVDE